MVARSIPVFSQARTIPRTNFEESNDSRLPSRLITTKGTNSMRS